MPIVVLVLGEYYVLNTLLFDVIVLKSPLMQFWVKHHSYRCRNGTYCKGKVIFLPNQI